MISSRGLEATASGRLVSRTMSLSRDEELAPNMARAATLHKTVKTAAGTTDKPFTPIYGIDSMAVSLWLNRSLPSFNSRPIYKLRK
jgi:hypothetical protein